MNTLLKRLFKNKVALFIVVIIIIFLPFTITNPAESDNKVLAVALGFDKMDDEIEASVQFISPEFSQGYNMNLKSISAKADTAANAIEKMSLYIGKKIGLAHCDVVVIGEGYSDEDVGKIFDYLLRGKKIGKNSSLIFTEGKAKDLIQTSVELNKNMNLTLKKILNFNEKILFAKQNTVDNFLNNYFKENSLSFVSVVNVEQDKDKGVAIQDQSSSGQSSQGNNAESSGAGSSGQQSGGQSAEKKMIVNDGSTALFKNGKYVRTLKPEEVRAFSWLKESGCAMIKIENVTTEMLSNAEMIIQIIDKNYSFNLSFKNNRPIVNVKLNLLVELGAIKNENQFLIKDINKSFINDDVKNKIKQFIQKDLSTAMAISKKSKTDFFYFYDLFYKFKNKELKNYMKSINNFDEFIENLQLFVDFNILKTT